jgi:hypothetical protein
MKPVVSKPSDDLLQILAEAGKGLKALQDEVIETGFDPDNPASIQAAIAHVEARVDAKVEPYRGNRLVEEAAEQIKAECRANILAQAEAAGTTRGTRTLH